jgi:hypothetical protein
VSYARVMEGAKSDGEGQSQPGHPWRQEPWIRRATHTFPKDPSAPRLGRDSWRRQAHIPLWQIWLALTLTVIPLLVLVSLLTNNTRGWGDALLLGLVIGTSSTLSAGMARARALSKR